MDCPSLVVITRTSNENDSTSKIVSRVTQGAKPRVQTSALCMRAYASCYMSQT